SLPPTVNFANSEVTSWIFDQLAKVIPMGLQLDDTAAADYRSTFSGYERTRRRMKAAAAVYSSRMYHQLVCWHQLVGRQVLLNETPEQREMTSIRVSAALLREAQLWEKARDGVLAAMIAGRVQIVGNGVCHIGDCPTD
ncbi:MAG: hypothetical protein KKB70_03045, partial [Proteobacteria bacterium]|nr:hypothetical protein [Pseudomonadota bacterium]MBU1610506.1 hypothetical protein [Pseudomonadota bacterium]